MDEARRLQLEQARHRIEHLLQEGRQLSGQLSQQREAGHAMSNLRDWQAACGAAIGQLSGGNKTHWLSRAYSVAFLSGAGESVPTAVSTDLHPAELVERILQVLNQARASLSHMSESDVSDHPPAPDPSLRFDFVQNNGLRVHLERAYLDSQGAHREGRLGAALIGACSVLEAILTDALERVDPEILEGQGPTGRPLTEWGFEDRIVAAERLKLISAACARLSGVARGYRALLDDQGEQRSDAALVTEKDARLALQVLRVVARDFSTGR